MRHVLALCSDQQQLTRFTVRQGILFILRGFVNDTFVAGKYSLKLMF
jgi:hypothetical protein